MGMAFFYAKSPAAQWRAPLGLAILWPVVMLIILPFIPESPRFLLMQGKVEKARDIVMKLHHVPGDTDQEFARSEFYQMQKQAEHDRELAPGWLDMIRNKGARKRTALAMGFAFIGQSTAVLVINN